MGKVAKRRRLIGQARAPVPRADAGTFSEGGVGRTAVDTLFWVVCVWTLQRIRWKRLAFVAPHSIPLRRTSGRIAGACSAKRQPV